MFFVLILLRQKVVGAKIYVFFMSSQCELNSSTKVHVF